jgi:putative acetyltransferase
MTTDDVTLRAAEPADFPAIAALHALAFTHLATSHHTPAQLAAHDRLTREPAYADDLARSHLRVAVSETGEIVGSAGWIAVPDQPGTARIRKVFVHPQVARRGLARRLVADAELRALAAGHRRLFVRANVNAVPLYERLGYRALERGVMATPDGTGLPVLFMEKTPAG